MTERRGDQGFTVTPQRLGGHDVRGGSRRRRVGLAVVSAAAAAIFTIGWLGPRLNDRPSFDTAFFATPTPTSSAPSPTPTPTFVPIGPIGGTPLPSLTRPEGAAAVSGRVPVLTDGLRVLDLASGDIAEGPSIQSGRDALFRASSGEGWMCVCFRDSDSDAQQRVTIEVIGIAQSGERTDTTTLVDLANPVDNQTGQATISSDLDTFDGNRRALLALGTRHGTSWTFSVAPIDVDGRRLGASVVIGKAAAPAPAASARASAQPSPQGRFDLYVDGPHVRVSPDGRVAFVWADLQRADEQGNAISELHAWRVALKSDGSVDAAGDHPVLVDMPQFCPWTAFAASDRLAWLCPDFSDTAGFDGTWRFGSVDLDGKPAGSTRIALTQDQFFGAPLFDRANGQVYGWDPTALTISRIDVHTLQVERTTFDPVAGSSPGLTPGGGSVAPDWHDGDSTVKLSGYGAMAGSPVGDHLYAVGFDPQSSQDSGAQPSRGIFVIDRATLGLVDRWAPAANYAAVATLPNGLVAASGMPGIQTDGQIAPWQASLTIHEPTAGRVLVRFGELGDGSPPFVVDR